MVDRVRGTVAVLRGRRTVREDPSTLQFGGGDFVRVADFVAAVQQPPNLPARAVLAVHRADDAARTVRLLLHLPRERVTFSAEPAGVEAWQGYGRRTLRGSVPRLAQSVLDVPTDVAAYLPGRPKRALRTGLNQARKSGIECVELPTPAEREAALVDLGRALAAAETRPVRDEASLRGRNTRWFAARSAERGVVALAVVLVDREAAVLQFLVATSDAAVSSAARYALHTHVVEQVSQAGSRVLLANSPFGWPAGLHQFQRILGYEVRNVVVRHEARTSHLTRGRGPSAAPPRARS